MPRHNPVGVGNPTDHTPNRPAAENRFKEVVALYAKNAPSLSAWMETNLPQGFSVFALKSLAADLH
jgi:hypothetical protein